MVLSLKECLKEANKPRKKYRDKLFEADDEGALFKASAPCVALDLASQLARWCWWEGERDYWNCATMIIDCARANHNLTNITIGGSNISDELASEFPEDICVNIFVLLFFEQSADCRLFFCSIISEWCFTVH